MDYNFNEIEAKWQKYWAENQTFKASQTSDKPKYYVLDMFPYPSGAGLHVGHPLGYIASDIYARYKRHQGFNVLHPQGYDSFGLPAEQYAIQTGQHPVVTTEKNIATYRTQLDKIGFSFDWSREVRTSSPEYYKWTQWIFIQLFNSWYNIDTDTAEDVATLISVFKKSGNESVHAVADEGITIFSAEQWKAYSKEEQEGILLHYRLTYLSETEVNWCTELGTVLANDEIVNGVSERGGHPVVRKKMKQWSMRISAYAQRLLDGLEKIDWPQPLKDSQTNWIGRSQGASVSFDVISEASETKEIKLTFKEIEALKEKRSNPSKTVALLWSKLRRKKGTSKFRANYTIGNLVADFVCFAKNVVVEFAGKEDEASRISFFAKEGFSVAFVSAEEIEKSVETVVARIETALQFSVAPKKEENTTAEVVSDKTVDKIEVFTTRPDTIFGVTFMTLAPEHELVSKITTAAQKEAIEAYITATTKRSERDRMADVKTISGAFTGAYAKHPFTGEKVAIWIGDYVLASYGTGAVMAVPCGDQRDYDFAKYFKIDIKNIFEDIDISEVACEDKTAKIANSDFLSGLPVKKATKLAIYELEKRGFGKGKINYRLRDAVFSRQRYWGEPFPVYYKDGMPQMIDAKHLPIVLPEVEKYLPTEGGAPPLGRAKEWAWDSRGKKVVANDKLKNKTVYPLELNTMPGWAGSSWYFNRYMDPTNEGEFVSKEAADYWQDVDLYIGGSEHATGHLLYARFWQKFLFDKGHLPVDEFAKKLINQGMILGTSAFVYRISWMIVSNPDNSFDVRDPRFPNVFVSKSQYTNIVVNKDIEEVEKIKNQYLTILKNIFPDSEFDLVGDKGMNLTPIHADVSLVNSSDELDVEGFKNHEMNKEYRNAIFIGEKGEVIEGINDIYKVGREVEKMSKSKYNVVNPDAICVQYGADSLRMFEMFLGPLEQAKPWKTSGISGVHSFLKKLWKLYQTEEAVVVSEEAATKEELKVLHKTIKKVQEDIETFSFNTSVSTFMIAVNELGALKCHKKEILEPLLVLISPYAPHIAEELWSVLGHKTSISTADFPVFDASHLVESSKVYPVSFNGKMRFTLELSLDLSKDEIENIVMEHEKTQAQLQGRVPKKVIIVPGKIVNIVG
jgi:leucyl-tRNA synthetase